MDTTRLQAYILFVSQHVNDMTKDELNELIEVFEKLIPLNSFDNLVFLMYYFLFVVVDVVSCNVYY